MRYAKLCLPMLIVGTGTMLSADAFGHIQLVFPTPRQPDQKAGPCGRAGSTRSENVTVLPPGATITVMWNETINHPGHFRVSFDDDGDDDFVDPAAFDDFNTAPSVIADNLADTPAGGPSGVTLTLPDAECDNCTLQVIQVMTDKPPYGDGNDIYYQCADLALVEGAPIPDPGTEPGPTGGGCDAGSRSSGVDWALVLALMVMALSLRVGRTGRLPAARPRTATPGRTRR